MTNTITAEILDTKKNYFDKFTKKLCDPILIFIGISLISEKESYNYILYYK